MLRYVYTTADLAVGRYIPSIRKSEDDSIPKEHICSVCSVLSRTGDGCVYARRYTPIPSRYMQNLLLVPICRRSFLCTELCTKFLILIGLQQFSYCCSWSSQRQPLLRTAMLLMWSLPLPELKSRNSQLPPMSQLLQPR